MFSIFEEMCINFFFHFSFQCILSPYLDILFFFPVLKKLFFLVLISAFLQAFLNSTIIKVKVTVVS